jgi:hypothetical protein
VETFPVRLLRKAPFRWSERRPKDSRVSVWNIRARGSVCLGGAGTVEICVGKSLVSLGQGLRTLHVEQCCLCHGQPRGRLVSLKQAFLSLWGVYIREAWRRQNDTYAKFSLFSGVCEPDRDTAARVVPSTNHSSVKAFNSFLGGGSRFKSV